MSSRTINHRPARPPVRRRAVASLLAALVVLGACGGGDDDSVDAAERADAAESTSSSDTTTTSAQTGSDGGAEADTSGDGQPTTSTTAAPTSAPAGGSTDEGAGGTGGGDQQSQGEQTAAPARPIVPRAGTYTYERTTSDSEGERTENSDATVERLSGDDGSGRVRMTTRSEQGEITSDATVDDAGTLVERSVIQSPLGEIDCDWQPDWYLVGAYAEGSTWTIDTTCSDQSTGLEVDVSITGSGRVVGHEPIEVNGATVTAWVLETDIVTEFTVTSPTLNGTQRTESKSRTWVDPAIGMQVRDETRNQHSGDFQSGTSEVVSRFLEFRAG